MLYVKTVQPGVNVAFASIIQAVECAHFETGNSDHINRMTITDEFYIVVCNKRKLWILITLTEWQ